MKLKKGYIMKELAGRYVVLPVGGEPEGFQGMIQMNVTGGFYGNVSQKRGQNRN